MKSRWLNVFLNLVYIGATKKMAVLVCPWDYVPLRRAPIRVNGKVTVGAATFPAEIWKC